MHLMMASAKSSVDSPFATCPFENLHCEPQKHFPSTLFQHGNDWPVGWQYFGIVGRSDICLPDNVGMSDRLTKLLNFLRYGSIMLLIFG
jgi:hypothetical protein